MNQSGILRWTRDQILTFDWSRFESFDKLVIDPALQERLLQRAEIFLNGESELTSLQLPWRFGMYLYGPSGTGKTAASRAIARKLGWEHFTIPAHEILDSHFLERALSAAVSVGQRVVVLEDVDSLLAKIEPEIFFSLIDHAMERSAGILWIATTRHAENTPKTQLLRPGRFDEAIRMELPSAPLRRTLLAQMIEFPPETSEDPGILSEWVGLTEGNTFAHFEEMRQIIARMRMEKRNAEDVIEAIKSYIEDQVIAGDRLGGVSAEAEALQERVQHIDPRMLTAALSMTDIFRTVIEKSIGDAAEQAKSDFSSDN